MTAVKKTKPEVQVNDSEAKLKAINENFATIEFLPDGTILDANDLFLEALGYERQEVQQQHHRIFCSAETVEDMSYKRFWKELADGKSQIGEFQRFKKDGSSIWINASYTPIKDADGHVVKVIKFAQDSTEQKLRNSEFEGKVAAISKSQAVIEFNLDGTIITANDNFLSALGYSLDEIQGQHHRMFCEPEFSKSQEYADFWRNLNEGKFQAGEYKRFGKGGEEIWINATYNPILNTEGEVFKVVKYATDVTEEKLRNANFEGQMNAIDKSQAVIEFNLDGTIIKANKNFLDTVGYSADEVVGKHHRIFCEDSLSSSPEYKQFWQKLNDGQFDSGEYKRIGKGGKEIWINASYNPIRDVSGEVYKVVKYATDLTKEKEAYNQLVSTFEEAANELLMSSEQLFNSASQMSKNAQGTMKESQSASAAAEEVSQGVQTVGTNTEEMTASIKEVSQSASNASEISDKASAKTKQANQTVSELGSASEEIGNVIKVISSIAQQTNLLALNATIEAARAGEAGKGFAIVANEVKELAKQTAKATEEISTRITNVQSSSSSAVAAIQEIDEIVNQLNEIASTTATAVEEQSAATDEVSRVVVESSEGVKNIHEVIKNVANSAEESSKEAEETLESSRKLSDISKKLLALVNEAKAS